jgi:hypothetical protein
VFILSCDSKKKAEDDFVAFSLVETGTFKKFPIDQKTLPFSFCSTFRIDENGSFFYYLNANNEVLVFDIENSEKINSINFDEIGPNAVRKIKYFSVTSDKEFLLINNITKLYVANEKGEVISKVEYGTSENGNLNSPARIGSQFYGDILQSGNKLLLPQLPYGNWNTISKSEFLSFPLQIEIADFKRISNSNIFYPKDYFNESYFNLYYSRVKVGDSLIYSFSTDHSIYVYDINSGTKSKVNAVSSEHISKFSAVDKTGVESYISTSLRAPNYTALWYDAFREVYYRVAFVGVSDHNGTDPGKEVAFSSNISIIILDKNLKKIGETKLPEETYLIKDMFINKEGLYLSINHPGNSDFDENYLTFELLELDVLK